MFYRSSAQFRQFACPRRCMWTGYSKSFSIDRNMSIRAICIINDHVSIDVQSTHRQDTILVQYHQYLNN